MGTFCSQFRDREARLFVLRQTVSQAEAGRLLGLSRARVGQRVAAGTLGSVEGRVLVSAVRQVWAERSSAETKKKVDSWQG